MLSNTTTRRIEWGDCDPAGIVFNPRFFAFFDHCTALLYEAAGWPKPRMVEAFGIAGCPLVQTTAGFKAPCSWGDDVEIVSTISDVRTSSFDIHHELSRDGKLCVTADETRVWTTRDPETSRLRSSPLPDEIANAFRAG